MGVLTQNAEETPSPMLRSAVGKTHVLRLRLVMDYNTLQGPFRGVPGR